MVNPRSI